jgi:hypothetical protein
MSRDATDIEQKENMSTVRRKARDGLTPSRSGAAAGLELVMSLHRATKRATPSVAASMRDCTGIQAAAFS